LDQASPRTGYTDGTLGLWGCTSSLEKFTIDSPLQQHFGQPGIVFSFAVLPHQQCPSRLSRGDLNITPRSPSQIGRGRQGPAALYWLHLGKRASMRGSKLAPPPSSYWSGRSGCRPPTGAGCGRHKPATSSQPGFSPLAYSPRHHVNTTTTDHPGAWTVSRDRGCRRFC
jgi:hypothetical protein